MVKLGADEGGGAEGGPIVKLGADEGGGGGAGSSDTFSPVSTNGLIPCKPQLLQSCSFPLFGGAGIVALAHRGHTRTHFAGEKTRR